MGTRANVRVVQGEREQNFYHHWDGYPDGVGHDLEKMLRGREVWDFDEICEELKSGRVDLNCPFIPCSLPGGDIEYDYTISCDNRSLTYYRTWDNDYERLMGRNY